VGTAVPADDIDGRTGKIRDKFNTDAYIKKAEGSLKRFGLDYVDFFLFPYAGKRETVMNENILKALGQLKKQGKTRFLGIASHGDTEEALKAAIDARIYDIAMISYNYKIKSVDTLNSAVADAVKSGMGIVAMKSTGGAFNEKGGSQPDSNAILKWILQNENISSIVSGMTSLEQLKKNIAMLKNIKLSEQELKELALASVDSETGLYCQQCGSCIPQCPYNLDIPAIMRSYMYAYGYKNIRQAFHTLENTGISERPCQNCNTCKVNCISHFDVKQKITDIARLREVPEEFLKA
jgi:predicted aldo/keto reductase-like oxidoreductase